MDIYICKDAYLLYTGMPACMHACMHAFIHAILPVVNLHDVACCMILLLNRPGILSSCRLELLEASFNPHPKAPKRRCRVLGQRHVVTRWRERRKKGLRELRVTRFACHRVGRGRSRRKCSVAVGCLPESFKDHCFHPTDSAPETCLVLPWYLSPCQPLIPSDVIPEFAYGRKAGQQEARPTLTALICFCCSSSYYCPCSYCEYYHYHYHYNYDNINY